MDWTVISAVAETIAAFGVVGSLIFVGFQVRQNSAGLRHAAVQAHVAEFQSIFSSIIDSGEMAKIWHEGFAHPEKLEGPDLLRFNGLGNKFMRTYQGMHWQWREGGLDDALFASMSAFLKDLAMAPGWQFLWRTRRHQYDPEFQKFMDAEINNASGKPLYPEWITE